MAEERNDQDQSEPLVLLSSFPLEDTGAEEEKIDSLWRQMMVYKALEHDLTESRARRAEAESVREQAEQISYSRVQMVCDRMKAEADVDRQEAKDAWEEANNAKLKAEEQLIKTKATKEQAQKDHEKILEDAKRDAQEILEQSRSEAQHEVTELRRQALKEIKTVLARVENMREATNEELETQRILTNVAKIKATALWFDEDEAPDWDAELATVGSASTVTVDENSAAAQEEEAQPDKPKASKEKKSPSK